jgi:hypothetical protein
MWNIDRAEHDTISICPADRGEPPGLNTQRGRGTHFLPTSAEIPGFVVLNAGLHLRRRLHDGHRKRPGVRAGPH